MAEEKKDSTTLTDEGNKGGGTSVTTPNAQNELILAKLREIDERNRATEAGLQSTKEKLDKKPEVPIGDKNKEFWNNPMGVLQEALNKTVQPLIEFRDKFESGTAYDKVKSSFKSDPRFKDFLSVPAVEAQVDSLMEKNEPTKEAFMGVLLGLRGGIELGLIPRPEGYSTSTANDGKDKDGKPSGNDDKSKTETRDKVDTMIPPHLRPSSAPTPKGTETKDKLPELTENEERLRKENKLTHAEFIELRDTVAPMDVIDWKPESERQKKEGK